MRWSVHSYSLIKLCGLEELESTRYGIIVAITPLAISQYDGANMELLISWRLIYQNEERLELISRISLFCWMAGTFCTSVVEVCTFSQQCGSFMLRKSSYSRSFLIGSFLCSMTFLVFHSILGGSCCWALVHICIANWYRCSHQLRYTKH
jgi:hypothetical protein